MTDQFSHLSGSQRRHIHNSLRSALAGMHRVFAAVYELERLCGEVPGIVEYIEELAQAVRPEHVNQGTVTALLKYISQYHKEDDNES